MKNIFSMGGQPVVPAQTKTIGNAMNIAAIKLIAYIVLCCISINAQAVPFTFEYGKIPFGKPMAEVLALVEDASIEENKYSPFFSVEFNSSIHDISFTNFQGIDAYFSGGLYVSMFGTVLNGACVKTITVTSNLWNSLLGIKLFFVLENNDWILFMVAKQQKIEGDNNKYMDIYDSYEKGIAHSLGIPAKRKNTIYKYNWSGEETFFNANFSHWNTKNTNIFLMMYKGFINSNPIILYVDINGWIQYTNCIKQYDAKKKKETEEKNKPSF
jgi:hypothetical protein